MSIIGIDLGTSHASLSYTDKEGRIKLLPIPQRVSEQSIHDDTQLPSVYFHSPGDELALPWDANPPVIGRYAREKASTNPERAIVSAKSWLCHKSDLQLPPAAEWGGKSAKEVSTLILNHLRNAYEHQGLDKPTRIAITVPASFDPVARQWTEEAAKRAGFENIELMEEPLAAFYAWLAAHADWNKQLKKGDSILVCDVGGGTSDFSLISVSEENDELKLDRIAVGRHLLLGGDNMDLALAHHLREKAGELDHWQFLSLKEEVRKAKETLLVSEKDETYAISVASRGSSLFASTKRVELTSKEVQDLLIEGFFPAIETSSPPIRRATGLQTMGLPYESDPAITKHLLSFLKLARKNIPDKDLEAHGQAEEATYFQPTHILFHGGVFKSSRLKERVLNSLESWGRAAIELQNPDLDHAVALGAAHYAKTMEAGQRFKVRTVAPRSYFLGIEANAMAVPGLKPRIQGLCILPQGTEEGTTLTLDSQEFALWAGEEVRFELFSGQDRQSLGSFIADAHQSLESVAELVTTIQTDDDDSELDPIPVEIEVAYDETGTLGVRLKEKAFSQKERSWRLAFDIRS